MAIKPTLETTLTSQNFLFMVKSKILLNHLKEPAVNLEYIRDIQKGPQEGNRKQNKDEKNQPTHRCFCNPHVQPNQVKKSIKI